MTKILSIIVPSYNMELYLPNALASLLVADSAMQNLLDVIVVNDGSKDRTSEIAHEYADKYPNVIRVIDKPNGNYGSCINAALPIATGVFIRVLDADDSFDTDVFLAYLRLVEQCARKDEPIDLILSDYCRVDDRGRLLNCVYLRLPTDREFGLDDIVKEGVYVAMMNATFRTGLLCDMKYRQTEGVSYTDTEWRFLPMTHIRKARYIRQTVYRYLIGREGQTVSSSVSSRSFNMYMTVLRAMVKAWSQESASAGEVAQAYIDSCFFDFIRNMYSICVSRMPYAELKRNFGELDAYVRTELSALYASFDGLWVSTAFHFNYVAFMRRHPNLMVPYTSFVRMVNKLAALRGSVR